MRIVRCKPYHDPLSLDDPGLLSITPGRKSRCPGWASSADVRRRLIADAIVDQSGGTDSFGRPKVLWNAVAGWTFVGKSTNEQEAAYNCYPDAPATSLHRELAQRAKRNLGDLPAGSRP